MADDFSRALLDALYAPDAQREEPAPTRGNILSQIEDYLRRRQEKLPAYAGTGEALATGISALAGSVPAGLAGLAELARTRDPSKAAQRVENVQEALTYIPRTEPGARALERAAKALAPLGVPAEKAGEFVLERTGSPGAATAASIALDPLNLLTPGVAKGAVKGIKAAPRVAGRIIEESLMPASSREAQRGAIAWHGSPHKFVPTERNPLGEFDPTKLGTGEGNQSYGVGAYLAESPGVATDYRKQLAGWPKEAKNIVGEVANLSVSDDAAREVLLLASDVRNNRLDLDTAAKYLNYRSRELRETDQNKLKEILDRMVQVETPGHLYQVDVPDEMVGKMLDWDKPLNEQPKEVQEALRSSGVLNAVESFGQVAAEKIRQLAQQPRVADWAKRDLLKDAESIENSPSPKHIGGVLKRLPLEYGISRDSGPFSSVADDFLRFASAADFVPNLDTGGGLVGFLQALNGKKEASEILQNAGIPGIKYLDQGSRSSFKVQNSVKGKPYGEPVSFATEQQAKDYATEQSQKGFQTEILPGTRNFVVFPAEQKNINIVERKKKGGFVHKAEGGEVTIPDMTDGGRVIDGGYFKKGGKVHISKNPDTMRMALMAGGGSVMLKAAEKAAEKVAARRAAKEVPPPLPRAEPKTKAEIEKIAERVTKAAKPDVLPAAERDANLAKMLQESKAKTRLYHGTKAHDEYADEPGQAFKQFTSSPTWLAKEPYTASGYSGGTGSTYPVYAQIKKPLVLGFDANDEASKAFAAAKRLGVDVEYIKGMSAPEKAWEVINHPSFIDAVERAGYDGISVKEGGYRTFGVLDPRRIKSATGNRGTFDVTNPDITKKRGGKVSFSNDPAAMRQELQKKRK